MVICLERGVDLHMAQLMPLPLTVSCSQVQIAVATLSSNSLRQTVHTHYASVHQAAKLVAALSGLAESNGSLPPRLWLTSPAGWLPRTGISSRTLRSAIEYGLPLPCTIITCVCCMWMVDISVGSTADAGHSRTSPSQSELLPWAVWQLTPTWSIPALTRTPIRRRRGRNWPPSWRNWPRSRRDRLSVKLYHTDEHCRAFRRPSLNCAITGRVGFVRRFY